MQEILVKLKPGDVVVTSQNRCALSSYPIRFGNFSKFGYRKRVWTHVAIYIGNGKIVESIQSGVVENDLIATYPESDNRISVFRRKNASPENITKFVSFCQSKLGVKYDLKALSYYLLVHMLPPILHCLLNSKLIDDWLNTKDAYYCSELAAQGLLESGEYCFDRAPDRIMPVEFYSNKYCFEKIYETPPIKESWMKKTLIWCGYALAVAVWLVASLLAAAVFIWVVMLAWKNIRKKAIAQK